MREDDASRRGSRLSRRQMLAGFGGALGSAAALPDLAAAHGNHGDAVTRALPRRP